MSNQNDRLSHSGTRLSEMQHYESCHMSPMEFMPRPPLWLPPFQCEISERTRRRGSRRRRRRGGWETGRGTPSQPTRGSRGASWAPPAGSGAEPCGRKRF